MKLLKSLLCLGLIANSIPAFASQPTEPAKTSATLFKVGAAGITLGFALLWLRPDTRWEIRRAKQKGRELAKQLPNFKSMTREEKSPHLDRMVTELNNEHTPKVLRNLCASIVWGGIGTGLAGFGYWLAGK